MIDVNYNLPLVNVLLLFIIDFVSNLVIFNFVKCV